MYDVIAYSAVAGVVGMGFGGVLAAVLLCKPSQNMSCWLLSFAAGVMLSVVCFGLTPETLKIASPIVCALGLIIGIVAVMALNRVADRITDGVACKSLHATHEEYYHAAGIIGNRRGVLRSGVLMFIAIALHNVPEGLAIGAGGVHDADLGFLIALMIALHNIPEGMAVAAPLLAGGVGRFRVVLLTAIAGATTLIGGIIGAGIGNISDLAVALSLSSAGGAMLYIIFGEILPHVSVMTKSRFSALVTLLGMVVGFVITYA